MPEYTGIKRFQQRYEFLTKKGIKKKWLRWSHSALMFKDIDFAKVWVLLGSVDLRLFI
jgi:hypothetical protein